jgi:hypothetical protein
LRIDPIVFLVRAQERDIDGVKVIVNPHHQPVLVPANACCEAGFLTIVSSTAKFTGELQALYGSSLPALLQFALPGE